MKWVLWAPLLLFMGFLGLAMSGLLTPSDTIIESRLIGQPMPEFSLEAALPDRDGLSNTDLSTGEPRLVNIFASWCLPCRTEAPQLLELEAAGIAIDAIAVRDHPDDIQRFLNQYGDPYQRMGADTDSQAQFAIGSSGVPESFVVDGQGIIRYQHVGEIRPEHLAEIREAIENAR